jgi:VanZ family protein
MQPSQVAKLINANVSMAALFVVCLGWISVATIAMLSLVPGSARPHVLATGQLEHFVAYAGTAALLAACYTGKRQLIGISVLLPIYAACLETLQIFVPGRNAQLIDAAGGAIGSWMGIVLVLSVHYWCWKRRAEQGITLIQTVERLLAGNLGTLSFPLRARTGQSAREVHVRSARNTDARGRRPSAPSPHRL